MDTTPQAESPSIASRPRAWRTDGPRFVLVAWVVSMVAVALAGIAAIVCVTAAATVRGAIGGQRSGAEFRKIAEAAAGSPAVAWASVIASQAALLACLWFFWRRLGKPQRERFGLVSSSLGPMHRAVLLAATVVPFSAGLLLAWVVQLAVGESDQSGNPLLRMWSEGSRVQSVAWVLLIALLPAFAEELFYRGFLQRGLLLKWGPAASITASSLLFAVAHGDPAWAAAIWPLGIWLGVVAWRTGSVHLPIAMHAGVNGLWTAGMMMAHRDPAAEPWLNGVAIGLVVIGAIAMCRAVVILRRVAPLPTPTRRARRIPRVILTCAVAAAVLMLVIPAAAPPPAAPFPTIADIEARATQAVSVTSAGDDGAVEFQLSSGDAVRVMLPSNQAGVQQVVVSLDTGGAIVWLLYSGELTGKGGKSRPRGVIEQLVSGAPTVLCLVIGDQETPMTVRATVEEDESRVASAIQRAEEMGWARRGRL